MARWWVVTLPVFLVFLAGSILLSVLFNQLFLLLILPFIPFVFRWSKKQSAPEAPHLRTCPRCGWSTANPDENFCPRDQSALV